MFIDSVFDSVTMVTLYKYLFFKFAIWKQKIRMPNSIDFLTTIWDLPK